MSLELVDALNDQRIINPETAHHGDIARYARHVADAAEFVYQKHAAVTGWLAYPAPVLDRLHRGINNQPEPCGVCVHEVMGNNDIDGHEVVAEFVHGKAGNAG